MDITQALDQAATEVESAGQDSSGGDDAQNIGNAAGGSTQEAEGSDLGVKDVPPELVEKQKELMRAFHSKTQALAEKERALQSETAQYKQDAQALYELSKQDWFKKAVEIEKAQRNGASMEIPEEALTDKRVLQD